MTSARQRARENERRRDELARQGFLTCPECAARRRTAETLRAHRQIAHGILSEMST